MINTTVLSADQLRLLVARLTEQRNNALDVLAITEINLATALAGQNPPEAESRPLGGIDLRNEVEKAVARIGELDARLRVDLDDLHTRLARVEHQADASGKEQFAVSASDDERFAVDAGVAQPQIVEFRHA